MTTNVEKKEVIESGVKGSEGSTGGVSRRRFLQILGSSSVVGAVGCAESNKQVIFPEVKGDAEQIPGVAVWYSSTCTECSAGCGIQVRTREGRAVKIEGNPDNPVNRGGLCALGQSSLQHHYDPDRVRQPLKRTTDDKGNSVFAPVSWDEAYSTVTDALKASGGSKAFITGETTGALDELVKSFSDAFNVKRVVYDGLQPVAVAKASELVYGTYGIPAYSFDKAQVVLNFGADFLETWVSPCEYARDWSTSRKGATPSRVIHVEPRLSLTGANADTWLAAKPGTEVRLAVALLKLLLDSGFGSDLGGDVLSGIKSITSKVSISAVSHETGIAESKILLLAQWLKEAKTSLVVAGGSAASTSETLPLLVAANLLNLVLGNIGTTVNVAAVRKPKSSLSKLASLVEEINKGEVSTLFVYGSNPAFTLPSCFGFGPEAAKKLKLLVSFSSHLDETTQLADLIIPSSSGLESWGDNRGTPGVYGLVQPTMTPVFDTKSVGDILLGVAARAGNSSVSGGAKDFFSYLQASWKTLQETLGAKGDFKTFWLECVERGGYFTSVPSGDQGRGKVNPSIFALKYSVGEAFTKGDLVLYPFSSVKTFDGRSANRPWMQEVPDPMTSIVWDSWAEIHPETASKHGVAQGDFVTIRNYNGEINVPAYVTKHILPGVIAVPLGQGHKSFGRFAQKVHGGNVFDLIPPTPSSKIAAQGDTLALVTTGVTLLRGRGKSDVVITQESDNQMGRELARTKFITGATVAASAAHAEDAHGHGEDHAHGGGHHEPKQMYKQREHPLYEWSLNVDLNACTGCSACVVACYAENNIAMVGKKLNDQGREMSWLRIERYIDEGPSEELQVNFLPMMCQHCHNAPCEPVCPVFATYHNDEGMNVMVYNRCVGTRYCSNNCSYKVRRFNFLETTLPTPLDWQLNPDVTKRSMGVMEKCTFCVQRILEAKDHAKDEGRIVRDGEVKPACVQSCPTQALVFGNMNDTESAVHKLAKDERAYKVLDHHLNTQPAVTYLERVKYKADA